MTTRFLAVDCLRGFAAAWVVLFHLWVIEYPNLNTQEHGFVPPPAGGDARFWITFFLFQYGYVGVTLFFVLSGFCIHLPFAGKVQKPLHVGEFYSRRFWRLYPAYLASIVFAIAALALSQAISEGSASADPASHASHSDVGSANHATLSGLSLQSLRVPEAVFCALFLQNFYPPAFQFNPVYWTLLYEVQFYLLYPLLLVLVRQRGAVVVLTGCLVVEAMLTYFPLPVRAICLNGYYEWFLGAFVAELWVKGRRIESAPGGALTLLLGLLFLVATFHPGLWLAKDLIAATAFACLLWTILSRSERQPSPSHPSSPIRMLAWLGMISYSLYLVHLPIISVFALCRDLPAMLYLSLPISLVIAWLFYHCFEAPFLWKRS